MFGMGRIEMSERELRSLEVLSRVASGGLSQTRARVECNGQALKGALLQHMQACYGDFGPTLAAEYLQAEGLHVSKKTLRRWLMAADLWKAHRTRTKRRHPPRKRRACCGGAGADRRQPARLV